MKRKMISSLMALCMLVSMYHLAKIAAQYTMSLKDEHERKVVVIDAGHGGVDPGKVGINGALEKDINLAIALLVAEYLQGQDIKVVMTRNSDAGLYGEKDTNKKMADLKNRLALMEASQAGLVVSIHQNAYITEGVHGAQVFYYESSPEGRRAAEILQEQLRVGVDESNDRSAKGDGAYYLLKESKIPMIIVECGFLSNGAEAELLIQEDYQRKMAWNITMGILQYLNGVV